MSLEIAVRKIEEAKRYNLTTLDLSLLSLTQIPHELSELTQLKRLILNNNALAKITGLEKLTQLTGLYLGNNNLSEITGLEHLSQLSVLNLSQNKLTEIKGLQQLRQLTSLDISENQITEIRGLETLTKLVVLNLGDNQLAEIRGLETLKLLALLVLKGNKLRKIAGLEHLMNLNQLDLAENQITKIEGLQNLKLMTRLILRNNKISKIEGLETLIELKELYLSFNQLTQVKDFENLSQLKKLDLRHNNISNITGQVLKFGLEVFGKYNIGGDGIYLAENPFINPPPYIVERGSSAIEEYFRQRRRTGDEPLNEAKLILLGDARSGKTSLANRLLRKDLPDQVDRTQGVDIVIGKYVFQLANGDNFKINIWDFAGQDKYKTLHQLFYTDSSLYVMVADDGNTSTDYDDWFQAAELFGEGSPLMLVLNEFKEGIGRHSFDSNYWKKRFPELLKEVFTANLGTKENFNKVEAHIRLLAQTLPHTEYIFPSNWAAIRRELNERRDKQHITLSEYLEICKENDLPEKESALLLSSFLHKIGHCLHYQKNELLKHFIILKNEWATDAVYKVLDDKKVADEKCGFFDLDDMKRIWSSAEYEDMRPQLLALMMQFKLAYQLPNKNEYVTPPILPLTRPDGFEWPDLPSLEMYIEYEFLPKALLTQFIVTRHADIAKGRTLVWRHGVILEWKGEALAEIFKTRLEGKDAFYVRAQGMNRKGMMTVVLKTFRELHGDYKGIKSKEKVPCICEECRGLDNRHYYDFDSLQRRLEKGRHEIECDKSFESVNILELLENNFVFEQFRDGRRLTLKEDIKGTNTTARTIYIFLASSSELLVEREKIEQALGRKNKLLKTQGYTIELLIWEDGKHIGKSVRSQDNYNLDVRQCNIFAMLFYSKVGKYSLEEFELANRLFNDKGLPRICIFQKHNDLPANLSKNDADSRYTFLERLKILEHFPIQYAK